MHENTEQYHDIFQVYSNNNNNNLPNSELCRPTDHRVKLKESEKRDKYLDLAREMKIYGTWK